MVTDVIVMNEVSNLISDMFIIVIPRGHSITKRTENFRRDRTTDMRPLDDTASKEMYSSAIHYRVGLKA